MKISLLAPVILSLMIISCSGEKPQIVLSSPEAFAYSLDEGWELNATVIASGFQQNEDDNDNYLISVSYSLDLVTPLDSLSRVDFGNIEKSQADEEFIDVMIESQIELNKRFPKGDYKLIFYATDNFSNTKDTALVKFEISDE